MRHDAKETAQNKIGQSIRLLRLNQCLEPGQVFSMMERIFSVGIDQHIHIKKNHEAVP